MVTLNIDRTLTVSSKEEDWVEPKDAISTGRVRLTICLDASDRDYWGSDRVVMEVERRDFDAIQVGQQINVRLGSF